MLYIRPVGLCGSSAHNFRAIKISNDTQLTCGEENKKLVMLLRFLVYLQYLVTKIKVETKMTREKHPAIPKYSSVLLATHY